MAITVTDFAAQAIGAVTDLTSSNKVELSQAVYKSLFNASDFAKERTIIPGIRNGEKVIEINNDVGHDGFALSEGCVPNVCNDELTGTNYTWNIANYGCDVEICLKTFDQNFLKFFNTWKTDNDEDAIDSALIQFFFDRFKRRANNALWTKSLIAEIGSGNSLLEGSNGHLTLAEAGAGVKIVLNENVAGSESYEYASPDVVRGYLDQVYEAFLGSDFYDEDVVIEMDKKTAMTYIQYLDSIGDVKENACCVDVEKVMQNRRSFAGLNFKGIAIKVRGTYDKIVTNPSLLNGVKPHFILLTKVDALQVGTEQLDKLSTFDLWYDKRPNVIVMRGEMNVGATLPTADYILVY